MRETKRCRCGETIEAGDGWPGEGDETICQGCWEAYCDRTWWAMVAALAGEDAAGEG